MNTANKALSIVHGRPLEAAGERGQTMAAFLDDVAGEWPDREALVANTAGETVRWTYTDLRQRAMAVARGLATQGIGKGSRVGILMSNRPEFIATVFGISLAGGVVVALNTFATAGELDKLIKAADIEALLFENRVAKHDFEAVLGELEPAIRSAESGRLVSERFPFLRLLVSLEDTGEPAILSWREFLRRGEGIPDSLIEARAANLAPSDTAILFFSSGSTGLPKGVLHNQRAVVLQWRQWPVAMGFTGPLRAWTANGFFWSGNFAMVIGSALSTGGALVLQSTFDAEGAVRLMVEEKVNAPFAMLHQWGRIAEVPGFNDLDLSHMEFLDPEFNGLDNPTIPASFKQPQAFGCTETLTINTTTWFGEDGETRRAGHGLPLPGNTLKIIDPVSGDVLPRGERGEIAVKGPTLMTGYLARTAEECFDGEGFYCTGDGGYVDDTGWLFWEGRLTDIIKTGGANVSPFEVDEVITTYPGVEATQTVGLPHDTLGEIVVSCIVPHDRSRFDIDDFRKFLGERLASYKLPREILILEEEELTLTAGGNKIKSAEVRELAASRLRTGTITAVS